MPLNKSNGNMYDFITHTWNPIKGACPHQCSYCYMDRIYKRFGKTPAPPHLDEKELRTNLGSGNVIFVGSSCDIFAEGIPSHWRNSVLWATRLYDENTFIWHTKDVLQASRLVPKSEIDILCATIESNDVPPEIRKNAPGIYTRVIHLQGFEGRKMVTIEPIMDFDISEFVFMLKNIRPEQANIGADTGNNHLPEPPPQKIRELIAELEKFTKVVCKKNLGRLLND